MVAGPQAGERVREHERLAEAQDRTLFFAAALHDGRMVAYTEMVVPRGLPETAYQDGTLVVPEHRGRRLGALVKLAALRELSAASPGTRRISTWNAESNRPMVAVNEALGYRVVDRMTAWQAAVPPAPAQAARTSVSAASSSAR